MRLVLAVEPDSEQGSKLAHALGHVSDTELVLATSTGAALAALGDRVPDIVLTSPLLPAQDHRLLAERLDVLADRAAHIQRLTIPVLAAPKPKRSGVLSSLRRNVNELQTDGCDAQMFAQQIVEYLDRAAAALAERAFPDAEALISPDVEQQPSQTVRPEIEVEVHVDSTAEEDVLETKSCTTSEPVTRSDALNRETSFWPTVATVYGS